MNSMCVNVRSADGKPLLSTEERADRWKEHIEGLCQGETLSNSLIEEVKEVDMEEIGDPVLRCEFDGALKDLSSNKAVGVDAIPSELLQSMGMKELEGYSIWCPKFMSLEKCHQTS
ncbi:hypothetical protein L798_06123 [Zootermopsis nevadensis]|uniref:Uncharacterized protein n=1 Tax=Zootermopsis nevadensis TaxID=136037 RepID=A0A067QPS9_ZOONE|nr:hypothetical protein L798_06123 [Zootermopsis nevadensis]